MLRLLILLCFLYAYSADGQESKSESMPVADSSKVIAFSNYNYFNGRPSGMLGNLIGDAVRYSVESLYRQPVDMVILPLEILRSPLLKGEVTLKKIAAVCPFDDSVVILKISGKDLQYFLNFFARRGGAAVSGVSFVISNMKASDIVINGEKIRPDFQYVVVSVQRSFRYFKINEQLFYDRKINIKITVDQSIVSYCNYWTSQARALPASGERRIVFD